MKLFHSVNLDPEELEEQFREEWLPKDKSRILFTMAFVSAALLGFLFLDFYFVPKGNILTATVVSRCITLTVSLILFFLLKNQKQVKVFDRLLFIWVVITISHIVLDSALRPGAYVTIIAWDMLTIIGIYTVLPFSRPLQTAAALYLSCSSASIWLVFNDLPAWSQWEISGTLGAYLFTNVFGMFLSGRFKRSDRQQYLLYITESESRKFLAERTDELEETVQEKTTALNRNELLMREMNHRVKNNLAIIQSLLNIQSTHTGDDHSRGALKESANRVRAVSKIHDTLSLTLDLKQVSVADYISNLVRDLAINFDIHEPKYKIKVQLEEITMDMDTLIPVALILNELITNAFKYAYDGRTDGEFFLTMKAESVDTVELLFKDKGRGLPEGFNLETDASMGMQIIASLLDQIGGEITYESSPSEGTEFRIVFKRVMR